MVTKTFSIYHPTDEPCRLFIEIGQRQVACWTVNCGTSIIHDFELFELGKCDQVPSFEIIFNEIKKSSLLLTKLHTEVRIIWENEQCAIVPSKYYNSTDKKSYLNILLGNCMYEDVLESTLDNTHFVYNITKDKNAVVQKHYPSASSKHKYQTLFHTTNSDSISEDYIRLSFYRNHFLLTLVKDKTLQLIQSFSYQTPEDALYYVLNTCKQFNLNTQTTHVFVSGLINLDDSVYSNLQQFLGNLEIDEMNSDSLAPVFNQYPSHYFSSFFKMMI